MIKSIRLLISLIIIPVCLFAQEFRTDNSTGNLLDANGNNFIMKGINIPLAWYVADVNGSIPALRMNTGINTARIVVETSTNDASWKTCVEACIANDIIPMVELHDATGSTNTADIQTMADFWISHADYLTSEAIRPYILINICNEWGTWAIANTDGDQWRDGFNQAVTSIRNAGITSTLVIDGVGYGQDIDDAKNLRQYAAGMITNDSEHNLLFSIHMYCEWAIGGDDIPGTLQWVRDNNIPFIVGEFGYQHATDGSCDIDEDLIMQECDNKGIGWLAWSQKGNSGGVEYLDLCDDWACSSWSDWGTSVFDGTYGTKTSETCSVFNGIESSSCEQPNLGNDQSLCGVSEGITLDANITNTTNKTFTWYRDGSQIAGSSATLSVSQAGTYMVEVDSAGVCVQTDELIISATIPSPSLTDATLCSPAQTTLEAGVSGSGLSYQWFLNNTVIAGETTENLTNVRTPGTYRVDISAEGCSTVSSEAIISSSNPTPIDNCRGTEGELTLGITNTSGTNYNWYTSAEGTTLAPGTSTEVTSYTTPSLSTTTTYYVQNMDAVSVNLGKTSQNGDPIWDIDDFESTDKKQQLTILQDITLEKVTVYVSTASSTIVVRVRNDADDTTIASKSFTNVEAGEQTLENIGIELSAGTYILDAVGSTSGLAYEGWENTATYSYPYTANGIAELHNTTTWNNAGYGPFYNISLSSGSSCNRLPVVARIDTSCGTPNSLPTVTITSPASDSSIDLENSITISATADDSDGSVTSVQFFANGTPISTDDTAPYSASWTPASAGSYELTAIVLDNDGGTQTSSPVTISVIDPNAQLGAYYTDVYRNMFAEVLDKTEAEVDTKVEAAFQQVFYGDTNEKLYYESGTNGAYILDINNNDVRSEGMSYGMMICLQLDKKEEFDKLWYWAKNNMQYPETSSYSGYFAWQCNTDGSWVGGETTGPAPDGEAYFVMALYFAAHRWGNDTGIYNYAAEADYILERMLTKDGTDGVYNMFDETTKLITFVPYYDSRLHTDPSYNLPGFFDLWWRWTDSNTAFWEETPEAARKLIRDASHPTSGLTADYSNFDGTPYEASFNTDSDRFMYDAWRTIMNLGMDYHWFRADEQQPIIAERYLSFFQNQGANYVNHYDWDGSNANGEHSTGLVACNAVASLAVDNESLTQPFLQEFWDIGIPTGTYRYYDGMLYMLALLNCSGDFKIWKPTEEEITQTIELEAGWNFISINVIPTDTSISTLFSGLSVDIVKNADGFWKNGQIGEMNSITNITPGNGYLVFMNSAETLSVTGLAMNENSIDITTYGAGWHMVGTPYQTARPFSNTLDATNCELIKNFDGFWIPEDATSSIDSFIPGEAYYYRHP